MTLSQRTGMWAWVLPVCMTGCALQPSYDAAPLTTQAVWSRSTVQGHAAAPAHEAPVADAWWTALGDPAIDTLMQAALSDSPTLAQAAARIDEARAVRGIGAARRLPTVGLELATGRAQDRSDSGTGTMLTSDANAGLRIGWEPDLFGRIRHTIEAASSRLDARTADALGVRLTLAAQVAHGVIGLRACVFSEQVQTTDITSRMRMLDLVRQRLAAGAVAQVDEARAVTSLAGAQTRAIAQREQCARQTNALARLSGLEGDAIRQRVASTQRPNPATHGSTAFMPHAPWLSLPLPASVIAAHPDIVVAERSASAAWEDIGIARAERMPRVNLGGLLAGNWLRAAGSSLSYGAWSLTAALTAPVFDGGAGASNVDAASARYRLADATLRQAVRQAAQAVEDALSGSISAQQRQGTSQDALVAARVALRATQAQWEAGAISLFELEDARRQASNAEDAAIAALRDGAQAWIALVLASGNTAVIAPVTPQPTESVSLND